jgi:hypothetical protein
MKQAATVAGCSVKFLIGACNHPNQFKRLKHKRIGRQYRTSAEWLNEWINQN